MEHPDDRLKKLLTSQMTKTPEEPAGLKEKIWDAIQHEARPRPAHRWKIAGAMLTASAAMLALVWLKSDLPPAHVAEVDPPAEEVQVLEGFEMFNGEEAEELEFASFYESI